MQIGKKIAAGVCLFGPSTPFLGARLANILSHLLLVCLVQLHHSPAGEVQSECGGEERKQSNLHSGVVQHLVLARLTLRIPVLELPSDSGISGSDGHTAGQDTTGLEDDSTPHPGKGTVDEGWRRGSDVFVRLGVDAGEASKHANVWDLDLVEQKETVVHGATAVSNPYRNRLFSTHL